MLFHSQPNLNPSTPITTLSKRHSSGSTMETTSTFLGLPHPKSDSYTCKWGDLETKIIRFTFGYIIYVLTSFVPVQIGWIFLEENNSISIEEYDLITLKYIFFVYKCKQICNTMKKHEYIHKIS